MGNDYLNHACRLRSAWICFEITKQLAFMMMPHKNLQIKRPSHKNSPPLKLCMASATLCCSSLTINMFHSLSFVMRVLLTFRLHPKHSMMLAGGEFLFTTTKSHNDVCLPSVFQLHRHEFITEKRKNEIYLDERGERSSGPSNYVFHKLSGPASLTPHTRPTIIHGKDSLSVRPSLGVSFIFTSLCTI